MSIKIYKHSNVSNKVYLLHKLHGSSSNKNLKGTNAQLLSAHETSSGRSVREQKLHEVFCEDIGSKGGERVHMIHLDLVIETLGDYIVRTMCGSRTGGWSLPCVMRD
jgi:hypothetical protein